MKTKTVSETTRTVDADEAMPKIVKGRTRAMSQFLFSD